MAERRSTGDPLERALRAALADMAQAIARTVREHVASDLERIARRFRPEPLLDAPAETDRVVSLRDAVQREEQAWIARALERTGGNIRHAARLLGLPHATLVYKVRKYDLAR